MTVVDQLSAAVLSGRVAGEDAEILTVFQCFLRETPPGLLQDLAHAPSYFRTRIGFEVWRQTWMAYVAGLVAGPTTRVEYDRLRPVLYGRRRPETDSIDRFHS